jgi:hypothetical protein
MSDTPSSQKKKISLLAQIELIDDDEARFLVECIRALPVPAIAPPQMKKKMFAKVLQYIEEEFSERVGIASWLALEKAGLLDAKSVTRYIKHLCHRIEFAERRREYGDERAERIADELKEQLEKFLPVYDDDDDDDDEDDNIEEEEEEYDDDESASDSSEETGNHKNKRRHIA